MSSDNLDIKFQKRFAPNLLSYVGYFIANIILGLAIVPFFLDTLGEAAYGLVPLATSLTSYVTLVIDAVNNAISRYLSIELQRGEKTNANQTYNTALFGTLAIVLILVPIALIVAWLSPSFFNIGEQAATDVFILFALIFGSVLIRTWSSNFMTPLFANNRLDLRNYVNLLNYVLQIGLVIVLFFIFSPSLPLVGLSYFISAAVALVLAYIFSRKVCPYLKITISDFSKSRMRDILGIAAWTTVSRVGVVLRSQIALIIVNITIGVVAGTEYSLALMWETLIVSIVSLVTNCFTPMTYSYRAKDDKANLIKFVSLAVKVTTLLTCLLVGLVCIFAEQLMTVWIGAEYARLSILMWFLVIPAMFVVQSSCCAPINAAYLRVKFPAIATIVIGVLTIILAVALPIVFPIGVYGVAIAVGITTFIIAGLISPMYGAYILKAPLTTFIIPATKGYITLAIFLGLGYILTRVIAVESLIGLIISGSAITIIYGLIILKFIFNKDEKTLLRSVLPSFVNKLVPKWLM